MNVFGFRMNEGVRVHFVKVAVLPFMSCFFFFINDEPCLLGNYCNLTVAQSCTILILNAQNSTLITSRHLHLFLSG